MRRTTKSIFVLWLAVAPLVACVPTAAVAVTDNSAFPRPPSIARRTGFWKRIFTEVREDQAVFHDTQHVHLVYAVIDLPTTSQRRSDAIRAAEKSRIRAILLRLHRHGDDPSGLDPEERAIFDLFVNVSERDRFLAAASRVRSQIGLRDRFARGLSVSHAYMSEMEHIFRAAGLPAELIWLPMIESCFDVRAYSHKGAAGIWQFMPTTGRLYGLRVDRLVDERRDPIRATRAAARYLAANYGELGHWPLAITAYNHGSGGIARGVRSVGSENIADLVERYQGRSFGFAGQNFYAEFLAAVDIARDPHAYFPHLRFEEPVPSDEFILPDAVGLSVAARATGLPADDLAALNPALSSHVLRGSAHIPRGYRLRIPQGDGDDFQRQVAAWTTARETRLARADQHRVRPGETLSDIATRYGTTVTALLRDNSIRNPRLLRTGQSLRVSRRDGGEPSVVTEPPTPATTETVVAQASRGNGGALPAAAAVATATETAAASTNGPQRHQVRRGQTLTDIAQHYGTTVPALKRENGIRNARSLRAGQVLTVPGHTEDAAPAPTSNDTPAIAAATPEHPAAVAPNVAAAALAAEPAAVVPDTPNDTSVAAAHPAGAAPDATNGNGPQRHQVRRGQTLTDIARHYGTTVSALQRQNGIRNARRLREGQELTIPGSSGTAAPASDGTPAMVAATSAHPAGTALGGTNVATADLTAAPAEPHGTPVAAEHAAQAAPEHLAAAVAEAAEADSAAEIIAAAPPAPNEPLVAAEHAPDAIPAADEAALAAVDPTAAAEQTATVASALDAEPQHRVRPGQTLSDIAKAYGTSVPALQEHNGIRDARDLRAGQVVAIPADTDSNRVLASLRTDAGYFHHRVRRGQNLSDIAKQYGTSVSTLQRYNGIRDARRLQARQVIRIPTS